MDEMYKYQCPSCGAPLRFDAEKQLLKCDSCESEFPEDIFTDEYAKTAEQPDSIDWHTQAYKEATTDMGEQPGFICESCAAEIVSDGNTAATECMYCGNPIVLATRVEGMLTPDVVIPFKITKEQAEQKLLDFYKGKRLLPNAFKDANRVKKITGMYVPFWLFSCSGGGSVHYRATKVRSWSDNNYNYTKTKHYDVVRAGNIAFDHIPVDASSKMDDNYMDGLEPYNYAEIADFNPMFLAGYFADKFDVDVDACTPRAGERVVNSTQNALRSTVVGYTTVTTANSNVTMQGDSIKYALMPVWMLNTKYEDKMYQFAINGQTGEVAGDLPVDKGKLWKWRIGLTLASAIPLTFLASLFF